MAQKAATWKGREILDPEDEKDLETRSAINEFHDGSPRHEAEEKAHKDYKKDKIAAAAGNGQKTWTPLFHGFKRIEP